MRPINPVVELCITAHSEAWKVLAKAIATRRAHDSDFRRAIASYHHAIADALLVGEKLDEVSKLAFSNTTWTLALEIGEASVPAAKRPPTFKQMYFDESHKRCMFMKLSRLKSDIFFCRYYSAYTPPLSENVTFTSNVLKNIRSYTQELLAESEYVEPARSIAKDGFPGADLSETEVSGSLDMKAFLLFPRIREEVGKIFKDWAEKVAGTDDPKFILAEAKFAYTAYAVRHLSVSNCTNRNTGFIDGADPERSYIYKCMKKSAKKYHHSYAKLQRFTYSGAVQLAEEIDFFRLLPYKLVDVVSFVTAVLDNVVSGLLIGTVYTPPQSMFDHLFEAVSDDDDDDDNDVAIAKDQELLPAISAMLDEFDNAGAQDEESDYRFTCMLREFHQRLLGEKQTRRLDMDDDEFDGMS